MVRILVNSFIDFPPFLIVPRTRKTIVGYGNVGLITSAQVLVARNALQPCRIVHTIFHMQSNILVWRWGKSPVINFDSGINNVTQNITYQEKKQKRKDPHYPIFLSSRTDYKLEKEVNSSIVCFTIISSLTLLHHPPGKTSVVQFNRFFFPLPHESRESRVKTCSCYYQGLLLQV